MKALSICLLSSVLFSSALSAQRGGGGHGDERRVMFDNRSSSKVGVYRCTSLGNYQSYRSLAPGEAFSMPATEGQNWTVATPNYYRLIEAIEVGRSRGWGGNRVVVTDSKVAAVGTTRLRMTMSNRTGRTVDLFKVVAGDEVAWSRLSRGQNRAYYSYQGRDWVVRDTATGDALDRFTVGSRSGTILLEVDEPRRGGGRHGGGGWGGREPAAPVSMTITNRSSRTISVLKRTTLGSRTVGSIGPRRTGRLDTEPGAVWRLEDRETLEVLQTVTVPRGRGEFAVEISPSSATHPPHRPRPNPAAEVTLRVYNDTDERIDVFRRRDGGWKHAKRINEGRFWDIDFEPGQDVSIRDPDSGRVLEAFRAPQGDRVVRVKGHGDHAHAESETPAPRGHRDDPRPPHDRDAAIDEDGRGSAPRPGAILRRILGRE
jgi:hypothetical protein